jgi:hypothetical protein
MFVLFFPGMSQMPKFNFTGLFLASKLEWMADAHIVNKIRQITKGTFSF